MKRVCTEDLIQDLKSNKLSIPVDSTKKDILYAYYHIHKNRSEVLKQLDGKEYTWRDVKKITDKMYNDSH